MFNIRSLFGEKISGISDGTDKINQRIGLLYIYFNNSSAIEYRKYTEYFSAVLEIREIYMDKALSKVEIISVPFKKTNIDLDKFNPWIKSDSIYWLSPPTDVDRDRKIKEIIN